MNLRFFIRLVFLTAPAVLLSQTAQENVFTLRTSTAWVDTGLDFQPGEAIQIAASASVSTVPDRHAITSPSACGPAGIAATAADPSLPLPTAAPGALIARLHEDSAPVLVGEGMQLHMDAPSHLFLGINSSGTPPCQAIFTVRVSRLPAQGQTGSSTDNAVAASESFGANSTTQPAPTAAAGKESAVAATNSASKTRGDELKSQLATAAQIFVQGQFGGSKTSGTAASPGASGSNVTPSSTTAATPAQPAAPALNVSTESLDSDLRHNIDSMPRRVNDQLNNLGDMVNFVLVGDQKDVQAALDVANWHAADKGNSNAVFNAIRNTMDKKDYLAMPMSTLYLFGRPQDFGYEQAEPIAMVASRHHFRIWKAPFTYKGHEVWMGAGTHDIGFAKDKRNNGVTHKIDPAVDGERDNIAGSLQQAGKAKRLTYYLPANPVQDARNATGDGYHSDGRMLVIFLQ
jgi:hypothetical protein